ncbi:MAG: glycosyltransferase [Candidatus Hydrogenedentes bacterium]|nr:glycosyltransferase [Candidatus Hydrogenedentota bacterium]
MKICLLNVLHEAYDKRVYQKIARSLAGAGHELVSICPNREPLPPEKDGIRFIQIPRADSKKQRLVSLARLVKLGRQQHAEVYFAPEPESWVAALIIKLTTGGKVVFDMHEHVPTEFAKFFPGFLQKPMEWLTVRFMRLFARVTDAIILTRESFEEPWRGLKVPRTVVINTNHLQPPCAHVPEDLQARYGNRPTIIHQGQFGDVRGSYQLLDAVKILVQEFPELKCIVLGDYVFGSLDDYKQAIADAGLADTFNIINAVPYDQVPAYISVSKVGLILFQPGPVNHTLAMPHKLFDYMRECRPVVAPGFALEVKHIMSQADCGRLVDVTDPHAIADAIGELLRDPALASRLGNQGRELVETTYNWSHDEQKLKNILNLLRE